MSILDKYPALKAEIDKVAEVAGYLWQKGWAERNGGNITVNIIQNGEIVQKKILSLPEKLVNIIHCKNPRCITSIEQELDHIFFLADEENEVYRCKYCEEKYRSSKKK